MSRIAWADIHAVYEQGMFEVDAPTALAEVDEGARRRPRVFDRRSTSEICGCASWNTRRPRRLTGS